MELEDPNGYWSKLISEAKDLLEVIDQVIIDKQDEDDTDEEETPSDPRANKQNKGLIKHRLIQKNDVEKDF